MPKKSYPKNNLPPPLQDLSLKELHILSGISLHLLEGFIEGKFKPREEDREKLTIISRRYYIQTKPEINMFIQRRKYRLLRSHLSWQEKDMLLNDPAKYAERLDELVDKFWDRIIVDIAKK